jgi:F-type H+-transporting ATPase subunit delta
VSAGLVAERYALALYELGTESGQLSALSDKLVAFGETYASSRELQKALSNPTVETAKRETIVTEIARKIGVPELGIKGLVILVRRRRIGAVVAIAARLRSLSDEKAGVIRAEVTTAQKMPEGYYSALASKLAEVTKKKIVLERFEDSSLLGGAVARLGDTVIDGSLSGRLDQAERTILSALSSSLSA